MPSEEKFHYQLLRENYCPDEWPDSVSDIIYGKAYADGHAYGNSEIEYHYEELVNFVDRIKEALEGTA